MLVILGCKYSFAQTAVVVNARLDNEKKTLFISQQINYTNNSNIALEELYFYDWANAFKNNSTPLADRFAEDYQRNFHYAKDHERGYTNISKILAHGDSVSWERPPKHPDIISLQLKKSLQPNETITIDFVYQIKIPDDKFTRYGYHKNGYALQHWLILPAVVDDEKWVYFSNKNLNDIFIEPYDIQLKLEVPPSFLLSSNLHLVSSQLTSLNNQYQLEGKQIIHTNLYLEKSPSFQIAETSHINVHTNISDEKTAPEMKEILIKRIVNYLENKLGDYPQEKILVSERDYLSNPVYGLNQLPSFLSPFPESFQYDMKLLKTLTHQFLDQTIVINHREEYWVKEGILTYLMMDYVEQHYPDLKLLGKFSEVIGVRWFHLADFKFNDRYAFFFMNMARLNLDQAIETDYDKLIKFNQNIANPYKTGIGFYYLEDYLEDNQLMEKSLASFYQENRLKRITSKSFETILKQNSNKNVDWFFEEYLAKNNWIDYKITQVEEVGDSLVIKVKNKENIKLPIPIYGIKDKAIVSKKWLPPFVGEQIITLPKENTQKVAVNYEGIAPEFNQRDNYYRVTTLLNKPFQMRLLVDAEDPYYTQFFIIPEFDYNLYDGFKIGPKLYNKTILARRFEYKVSPKYGFVSNEVSGSASIDYTFQYKNQHLFAIRPGIGASRNAYAEQLYYHRVTPFINFAFRDRNLRSNKRQSIGFRSVNVFRDRDAANPVDEPDYSVHNLGYSYSDRNFDNFFTGSFDYQWHKDFSKVSITTKWRKLFLNSRQLEFRLFAGTFLKNDTRESDYFSFALDRPTDYLFDYNYYGRSEDTGLFSQQFIEAEGGFKSKLQPAFANQWMTTLNGSYTIWNWILLYGDAGLVKNENQSAAFVYDSGIRLNLVQDYFEIYFPLYSNLGWEPSEDNYDQKIRFIVSLDIKTLIRLFTRRWY
ncbi:metalloprotease [Mesonia sp. K7]|uniref:metalloprotease n=1 Tax=Mesonia sp. K7 TaxID=2218606 RepID=UPI001F4632DA|nr:metalloprotease [Mesonia sp. K7]